MQAYNKANQSLKPMQARYKLEFDTSVRSPNRNLRAGDKVYLDLSKSSQEQALLESFERAKSKLEFKSQGPYTIIANHGHSLDVEINGIPEKPYSLPEIVNTRESTASVPKANEKQRFSRRVRAPTMAAFPEIPNSKKPQPIKTVRFPTRLRGQAKS